MERPTEEAKSLKACVNDLVGISTLPAIWKGNGPKQILASLLDVLQRMLCPDFTYARLKLQADEPIEMTRISRYAELNIQEQELCRMLNGRFSGGWDPGKPFIWNVRGNTQWSLAAFPIGLHMQAGEIIAGSRVPGFPNKIERLLLNAAVNQASIALQPANESAKSSRSNVLSVELDEFRRRHALLTRREREVLPFVISGWLSKQTAAKLGTSEITIRVHRRQIMRKMQACSLAELIRMADKLGIQ